MIKNISETKAKVGVLIISIVVAVLVGLLNWGLSERPSVNFDLHIFPKFHAFMNSLVAICLVLGLVFIKKKDIAKHRVSMMSAFILSSIFLLSYVVYHTLADPTSYGGDGPMKYVYYFMLLTHIVLAAGIMPFILMTFYYSLSDNITKHRKLAKITWPLWFYVAITGVFLYFMISPYYI